MADANPNSRLEAFCDGVFAIAITLLILEVKVPPPEKLGSTQALWLALRHMAPEMAAFVLSFVVIFITWVNHHAALKLVRGSSASFIYANGFLLLTVVALPFPTALVGAYLRTDHAGPAVVIYNAVIIAQGVAWQLVTGTALRNNLQVSDHARATMREQRRNSRGAIALYSVLAIAGWWLPRTAAMVTAATWIYWLVLSIRLKHA